MASSSDAEFKPIDRFALSSYCHRHPRDVPSSGTSSLLGSLRPERPSDFTCIDDGIQVHPTLTRVNPLESSADVRRFQQHLFHENNLGSWSMAVWFTLPAATNNEEWQSILSFGLNSLVQTSEDENLSCEGRDYMQLLVDGKNQLALRFEDSDDEKSCRVLSIRDLVLLPDALTQFTFAVGPQRASIYLNGVGINMPFFPSISEWDPRTSLQLFATNGGVASFQGIISQVSLFDMELSPEQVARDFARGVLEAPTSPPLALEAIAGGPIVVPQDSTEPFLFWIEGNQMSRGEMPLEIQVLGLPKHGDVFASDSLLAPPFPINLEIPFNTTGLWLQYRHHRDDFFSVPRINTHSEPDRLEFRLVVAHDAIHAALDASPSVLQAFEIQHVNHTPRWNLPEFVNATLKDGAVDVNFGSLILEDDDYDLNPIRVDISVAHGSLTLHPEHSGLAVFEPCKTRDQSNWRCSGTGVDDQLMTFVALPSDVQRILWGMSYRGFTPGAADEVHFTVFDGSGGSCLAPGEHQRDHEGIELVTIHRECFVIEGIVQIGSVAVPEEDSGEKERSFLRLPNSDFREFGLPDLFFWLMVISVLVCCTFCIQRCPSCLARGTAIVPDGFEEDSDAEGDTDDESVADSVFSTDSEEDSEGGEV